MDFWTFGGFLGIFWGFFWIFCVRIYFGGIAMDMACEGVSES